MDSKLAIIIPAYKAVFLDYALNSLANQTCLDFTVYIGDDNSPYDLKPIVEKYFDRLDITYQHFDENLGGSDLIAQWNRCVNMLKGENYFCLFSDDDLMESNNVERFYQLLYAQEECDVYHFDIDVIDGNGKMLWKSNPYPSMLSSSDFFHLLYTNKIDARMPEFIFRTEHFKKVGGFVHFDLAYRSDNATVMICAQAKGVCTVPNTKVQWRDSGINVSSDGNILLTKRRVLADIDFFNWIEAYYKKLNQQCPLPLKKRLKLIVKHLCSLYPTIYGKELYENLKRVEAISSNYVLYLYCRAYLIRRQWKKKRKMKKEGIQGIRLKNKA
ncbi:MAG: glycosyltransferase family 2 protein [Bacteroides sp.]